MRGASAGASKPWQQVQEQAQSEKPRSSVPPKVTPAKKRVGGLEAAVVASRSSGHSRRSRSASLERESLEGQTSSSRTSHQCFAESDRSVRREGTKASPGHDAARQQLVQLEGSCSDTGSYTSTCTRGSNRHSDAGPITATNGEQIARGEGCFVEELHGPVERPRVRQRVSPSHIPEVVPPMPTLIPHDLSNWILDRHSDLQEATSAGDIKQVLELTSLQSQGAEKLAEVTGGMAT